MNAAAIARQLVEGLIRSGDPRVAKQSQTFFKVPVKLLGAKAATMRALARAVYGGVKGNTSPEKALAVCKRLLPDGRFEVKITALLFLACQRKHLDQQVFTAAEHWIHSDWCSSWSVIDTLGIEILGPMLQGDPDLWPLTRDWVQSPNMWLRRAGIVALVKPVRRGLLLKEAYQTAAVVHHDSEDLVRKAVGWMLREAGKTDMTRLQTHLKKHGSRMARTTLRHAIERIDDATRKVLLESTRNRG